MKIKISATFEGKCDVCNEEKVVFTAGDEDTKKAVTICRDCAAENAGSQTSDIVEKYGHVDESLFSGDAVSIQGMDKLMSKIAKLKDDEKAANGNN
jgi:protein-arginine kinase activator protein McsA